MNIDAWRRTNGHEAAGRRADRRRQDTLRIAAPPRRSSHQNMRTFEVDEVVLESTGKQTAHRVICRGVRFLSSSQSATCQVSGVSRGSCSTLAELTAWQLHRSGPKTSKRLG